MNPATLDKNLTDALALLRRKDYLGVVNLLTPQVFLYRNNHWYFYLLGYACLAMHDEEGAWSHIHRSEDLEGRNPDALVLMGILMLRRHQVQEALEWFLKAQEFNPRHEKAEKAIELIKVAPEATDWGRLARQGALDDLLPALPRVWVPNWKRHRRPLVLAGLVLLGLAVMVSLVRFVVTSLSRVPGREIPRVMAPAADATPVPQPEASRSSPQLVRQAMTEGEIRATVRLIQDYFKDYRDNLMRVEINRILNSNATIQTKNQVQLLIASQKRLDFATFRDPLDYSAVAADPWLHEGVHVRWSGVVTALGRTSDQLFFDLLVGYHQNPVAQGSVMVRPDFPVELRNGDAVEIIGRVELDEDSQGFHLVATSLRPLLASP